MRPGKNQISLGIRPVWSESPLCTQAVKGQLFLHADSQGSDQTGRMLRLIWVFVGRKGHFVCFVMRPLNYNTLSLFMFVLLIFAFCLWNASLRCFTGMSHYRIALMEVLNFRGDKFSRNICLANIAKINRSQNWTGLQYRWTTIQKAWSYQWN